MRFENRQESTMAADDVEDSPLKNEVVMEDAMSISPVSASKKSSSASSSNEILEEKNNNNQGTSVSSASKEGQVGIQTTLYNEVGGENDVYGKKETATYNTETMDIPSPSVVGVEDDTEKVTNDDDQVNISNSAVSVSDDDEEDNNNEDMTTKDVVADDEENIEKEREFEIEMNDCETTATSTTTTTTPIEASPTSPTLIEDDENQEQQRQKQQPQPESNNDYGYEDCAPTVADDNDRRTIRRGRGGSGRRGSLVETVMGWVEGSNNDNQGGHPPPPQQHPEENAGNDYGYEDCAPTVSARNIQRSVRRNRSGGGGGRRGSLVGAVMGWVEGNNDNHEGHPPPQQQHYEQNTGNDYGYEDCTPTVAARNNQRSVRRNRSGGGGRRGSLVGAVMGWVDGSNENQDEQYHQKSYQPQQQPAEIGNDYGYEDCAPTVAKNNGSGGGRRGSLVGTVMGWVSGDEDVSAYGYEHAEPTNRRDYDDFGNADLYGYGDAAPTVAATNHPQTAGRSNDGRPGNPNGRRGSLLDRVMGWEQQEDNPYGYEDAAPTTRRGSLLGGVIGWKQQDDNPYGYEDAAPTTRRGSLMGSFMGWNQQQEQAPPQAQPEHPQQDPSGPNATGERQPGNRRGSLSGSFIGWDHQHENPYGYEDDPVPTGRRGSMVDHIMAWAGAVNQEHFFRDSSSGLFNMGSSGNGEPTSYEHRRATMDCVGSTDNSSRPRMVPPIERGSFRRAYSNDDAGIFDYDDQQGGFYDYDGDYSSNYNDDDSSYYLNGNGDDQSMHSMYSNHQHAASAGFAHPGEQNGGSCSSLKLHSPVPRVLPPPQSPRVGGHSERRNSERRNSERRNSLHAMVERAMAYVNMSKETDPRDGELCAFGTRRDSLF